MDILNGVCGNLTLGMGITLERRIDNLTSTKQLPQKIIKSCNISTGEYISDIIRMAIHHRLNTVDRLREATYNINTNIDVRIKYLANEIDKPTFMKMIQRRDKKIASMNEYAPIVHTFTTGVDDLVKGYLNHPDSTATELLEMIKSIEALELYVNQCLQSVTTAYKITPKHIRLSLF